MYYLIKGKVEDEFGCGSFEWVVEASNQDEAIAQLEDDEELESIREISVEERIEREEHDLLESIKREHIFQILGDVPIREANKQLKELNANPEIYYSALATFNKRQRLLRLLKKQKAHKEWTVAEFEYKLERLSNATTEKEFNKILSEEDK